MTGSLRKLFTDKITTAWLTAPPLPLIFDNQKGHPDRIAWARVSYQFGEIIPAQIGLNMERCVGIVNVQVFLPPETGTLLANDAKDKLGALLVGQLNFTDRGNAGTCSFSGFGSGPEPAGARDGYVQYNCAFTFLADVRR